MSKIPITTLPDTSAGAAGADASTPASAAAVSAAVSVTGDSSLAYSFHAIASNAGADGKSPFAESFDKREVKAYLDKWNVSGQLRVHKFRYEQAFDAKNGGSALTHTFLSDFLNSAAFRATPTLWNADKRKWMALNEYSNAAPAAAAAATKQSAAPPATATATATVSIIAAGDTKSDPTVDTKADTKLDSKSDSKSAPAAAAAVAPAAAATTASAAAVRIEKVEWRVVPATAVSMDMFDKLKPEVVASSGYIKKCMEEISDSGVPVADELRRALLVPDSEYYSLFTEADRAQFLFRIFTNLAIGGSLNQFEDYIEPYLDTTKVLYKAMLTPAKNNNTNEVHVSSAVFELTSFVTSLGDGPESAGAPQLFGSYNPFHACFVVVDPIHRHLIWYYFAYTSYW